MAIFGSYFSKLIYCQDDTKNIEIDLIFYATSKSDIVGYINEFKKYLDDGLDLEIITLCFSNSIKIEVSDKQKSFRAVFYFI